MKRNIYLLCTLLCLMSGCKHNPSQKDIRNVTSLAEKGSWPETSIVGDTLYYDALYPTGICVIDTFLLIAQHKDKDLIHVYSLRDTTKLGKFLNNGGGPNEVYMWNGFAQFWKEKGEVKLLIQSYPQFVAILNLNRSLEKGKAVFEKRFSFDKDSAHVIMPRSNVAYLFNDKFLLARAPERVKGLKDYTPSFQWFDFEKDQPGDVVYLMDMEMSPNPFLFMPAGLSLRPSGDKLCYACKFINAFSILNVTDGAALQVFPDGEKPDIAAIVDAQSSSVYYGAVTSTDNYLFLATSRGIDYDKVKEAGMAIEVYNWNGEHLHRFLIPDAISYMAIDETGHTLYAVMQDSGMKRYKLDF